MKILKTKSFELAVYAKGDQDSSKFALVIPGRLDTKDYSHMISHVDYLANRGYFALSFDPPGTWESPGSIKLYTVTNWLRAINELIELFGNKPTVLMGHSQGGNMTILAGARNKYVSHIVAVMASMFPSKLDKSKLIDGKKISYRDLPPNDEKNKKIFELPLNYFEDAAKYNILDSLKKCIQPKLFFLGTKDALVKPEDVRAAYRIAQEPKIIHELNSEHGYRRFENIVIEVNDILGDFLNKY